MFGNEAVEQKKGGAGKPMTYGDSFGNEFGYVDPEEFNEKIKRERQKREAITKLQAGRGKPQSYYHHDGKIMSQAPDLGLPVKQRT